MKNPGEWPPGDPGTAEKVAVVLFGTTAGFSVAVSEPVTPQPLQIHDRDGGPCWDRTSDQLVKSQLLYR